MSHPYTPAIRSSRLVKGFPIFYGWIILLVGTLGLIMTAPGQTYAVSIFIEHFINDLGISRSLVSTLYTIGTLVGSFALPLVGQQIDRRGPRLMMSVVVLLFGLACVYMGIVQNAIMLGLGFMAIRMLGQGSLGLISQNVINQWWVRRRGTMIGISGLLVSLVGMGAIPNLINWLIPIYGWRTTYALLGVLLLFVMLPLAVAFVRNQPEQYGLQPDGMMTPLTSSSSASVEPAEENWTLPEAMRTPIFWVFMLGLSSIAMLVTGLFFHMVSIFNDNGLSATVAASVFVPIAATTAVVNLGSGILVDRVPIRLLMAIALFLQATTLIMAQFLQSVQIAFLYGVMLGIMLGLMGTINGVSWAKYYGRRHLGSITGVTSTVLIAGSALGPMPFGIARDMLGSYNLTLTAAAVIPLILGLASLFVDRPIRQN